MTKKEADLNVQLGFYELCYRKIAIYSSSSTIYFVGGCNSLYSSKFNVLVAHKGATSVDISEEVVSIPVGPQPRKEEILSFLRFHYTDSGIAFTRKCFGLVGFMKFTVGYYALLADEIEKVGELANHEIFEIKKCKVI